MSALLLGLVSAPLRMAEASPDTLHLQVVLVNETDIDAVFRVRGEGADGLASLHFELVYHPELVFPTAVEGVGPLAGADVGFESLVPGSGTVELVFDPPLVGSHDLLEIHMQTELEQRGTGLVTVKFPVARDAGGKVIAVDATGAEVHPGLADRGAVERYFPRLLMVVAILLFGLVVAAWLQGVRRKNAGLEDA